MTTFDKREEGFEKKFAHDEELRFRATARRNKLLGLWAADKLGLAGESAETYAKEVVASDFEEPGDHDVFRKVRKDLDAKGVAASDEDIRHDPDMLLAYRFHYFQLGEVVAPHCFNGQLIGLCGGLADRKRLLRLCISGERYLFGFRFRHPLDLF